MGSKLVWYKSTVDKVITELGNRLESVGQFVELKAKEEITQMGAVKTGKLKDSITHVTDKEKLVTRIGTDVDYAPNVELGTMKMSPRPFLRYSLHKNENQIKEILTKK